MSQIQFFATRNDILPLMERVERRVSVKYVRMGRFLTSRLEVFKRAADLPDIGSACSESAVGCEQFLICDPVLAINLDRANDEERSYHVNQLYNPDTIVLNPGGLWKSDVLFTACLAPLLIPFPNRQSICCKSSLTRSENVLKGSADTMSAQRHTNS